MHLFKVGDQVRSIADRSTYDVTHVGWIGIVTDINTDDRDIIRLEGINDEDHYGYWVQARYFVLVSRKLKRNLPDWF